MCVSYIDINISNVNFSFDALAFYCLLFTNIYY